MKNIKAGLKDFMKKKSMRIGTVALCAALAVGWITLSSAQAQNASVPADYTVLYKTDLSSSISVKGIVESAQSRKVYSNLSYNVETIYVEVGDYVTEGTVLAQLDTVDLDLKISQKKEDLSASDKNNLNQLQNSQRQLNDASANLSNGTNSQIVSAESSFNTAQINLQNAQKAYNDALHDQTNGINSKVLTAESSLESAEMELNRRQTDYDNNKALFDVGAVTLDALNQSERDLNNAQIQYDDALSNLENAKTSDTRTLEQAEENLATAQLNYNNAQKALEAAKTSAQQDISNYRSSVQSASIAVNNNASIIAIEEMEKELDDSTIRSPIDGTVTAVYAKEGVSGQGLLFVVEDVADLKIQTYIKEYDVANVKEGMAVVIKSDATGEQEYEGVIHKIEPAAVKTSNGETANSSDVEFGAEISVVSADTDLKIGMNTRMNIILDSREDIYRVPYDAVRINEEGQRSVFLLEDSGVVREVIVITGLETDFYIEIEGDGLVEGAKVLNDAGGLQDGMKLS